ncbi:MAG: hypothetical protein GF411_20115, partial [Candidatus Lokiarchaeota archaeon]|nr:hypothetical protein [Candidatus Lokiarchaeota archaeon]
MTTGDNITEIDSLEFDADEAGIISMILIDSTHFAIAYRGPDNDGFVKTFSIDGNCDNITEIDSLEFDTTYASYISMILIDSTHFAIAYVKIDVVFKGYVKTFSIDGSYDNITEIESLEFDS